MQYLLASDGLAVHAFNKAEDFLAHVAKQHVPVVVLDIWMEKVTGLEVLARLCALSPKTRVIVITARDDLAARATAMAIARSPFSSNRSTMKNFSPPCAKRSHRRRTRNDYCPNDPGTLF